MAFVTRFPRSASVLLLLAALFLPRLTFSADQGVPTDSFNAQPGNVGTGVGSRIRKLLEGTWAHEGPGGAVLVIKEGRTIFSEGRGVTGVASHPLIGSGTVFDLASLGKQFTAAAILLLAQEGKIDFEDSVASYLPQFKVTDPGEEVTIRDLVCHVSGFRDFNSPDSDCPLEVTSWLTPASRAAWLAGLPPRRKPGVRFEFNDSGYALLARIVETISGLSFQEFMETRFFKPLGMARTFVAEGPDPQNPFLAEGFTRTAPGVFESVGRHHQTCGAGSVFSAICDLEAWEKSLQKEEILCYECLSEAKISGRLADGRPLFGSRKGVGYGFGWYIDGLRKTVFHGGKGGGFSCWYVRDLGHRVTVVVLSNLENSSVEDLAAEILEISR